MTITTFYASYDNLANSDIFLPVNHSSISKNCLLGEHPLQLSKLCGDVLVNDNDDSMSISSLQM